MIFKREMTEACSSFGTVRIVRSTPSIRMRTCRSISRGSRWISLARSVAARSMMLFTRRTVGADCASASSPSVEVWNDSVEASSAPVVRASRFISSMARAAPSLPYSVMMARISESCVVTIGMTRFRVAFFTASMAMKFSGSLMARHTSSGEVRTGTTLYWRATFLLITRLSSGSRSIAERSTNSTPSCICSASMRPGRARQEDGASQVRSPISPAVGPHWSRLSSPAAIPATGPPSGGSSSARRTPVGRSTAAGATTHTCPSGRPRSRSRSSPARTWSSRRAPRATTSGLTAPPSRLPVPPASTTTSTTPDSSGVPVAPAAGPRFAA